MHASIHFRTSKTGVNPKNNTAFVNQFAIPLLSIILPSTRIAELTCHCSQLCACTRHTFTCSWVARTLLVGQLACFKLLKKSLGNRTFFARADERAAAHGSAHEWTWRGHAAVPTCYAIWIISHETKDKRGGWGWQIGWQKQYIYIIKQ